jgi:hypothetical protein
MPAVEPAATIYDSIKIDSWLRVACHAIIPRLPVAWLLTLRRRRPSLTLASSELEELVLSGQLDL